MSTSTGKTALSAVEAAVMALLAADATLMAASPGGVWDYVPADPSWPYVCLESAVETPKDTLGRNVGSQGRTVELTFLVLSQYQGRQEQTTVLDALVRVLRHGSLTVTGWSHQMTRYTRGDLLSPFEVGSVRAGWARAIFEIDVKETT